MTIGLINGSIRSRGVSASLMNEMSHLLQGEDVILSHWDDAAKAHASIDELLEADAWVLFFGVYFDGLPSHLLRCLEDIERSVKNAQNKPRVYVLINCGFPEPVHAELSFSIVRHWCERADLEFSGGILFGSGGAYLAFQRVPMGTGEKKHLAEALSELASSIREERELPAMTTDLGFSQEAYFELSNEGWRQAAKKRGLAVEDLYATPRREPRR